MPKSKAQTADTETKPKAAPKPKTPKRAPVATTPAPEESAPAKPIPTPKVAKPAKAQPSLELLTEETFLQFEFTPDAIAVRAYFLAEQRRHQGLHPDPVADWLEAERQVLSEIESISKPAKKPARKSPARKPESF